MMRLTRPRRLLVGALAVVTLFSAGCSRGDDDTGGEAGNVNLTWWHNANNDPGKGYFQKVADEFTKANPNVTIKIEALQNETLRERLPVALQSDPPDIFQQWGGGEMAEQVKSGRLMDITDATSGWIGDLGTRADGWKLDGKVYGVPYTLGVVGFWYRKDMFQQAGVTEAPTTWAGLLDTIAKLKAANIAPIALGGKDRWPDAFYYGYLAVRHCSQEVIKNAATNYVFDDPCFVEAGKKIQELIGVDPFQDGFLATPAQQGASSAAGLVANGKAAMELQGHWNPGVMQGLTPDQKALSADTLGWFPFPEVEGAGGDPKAAFGGGDGFSCSYQAPPECADFLKFLMTKENQIRYAELGIGLPVTEGAAEGVKDPNLQQVQQFRDEATYVQLYFDIAMQASVGQALNEAVANMFAGQATPDQVVAAIKEAAKNR